MRYFALISILFVSLASQAAQVCQNIPSTVVVSQTSVNFDGSVTYKSPELWVNGERMKVGNWGPSARGLCALFKQQLITFESLHPTAATENQHVVILSEKGELYTITSFDSNSPAIDWIICK